MGSEHVDMMGLAPPVRAGSDLFFHHRVTEYTEKSLVLGKNNESTLIRGDRVPDSKFQVPSKVIAYNGVRALLVLNTMGSEHY